MTDAKKRRVGVVGCGQMGAGIAEVWARAGHEVTVVEGDAGALEAGRGRIAASLGRASKSGKITETEMIRANERIDFAGELERLHDAEIVFEAVTENLEVKIDVFRALDAIVEAPDGILCSNTSSIPIIRLGVSTNRPDRVLGVHFFNPVPVLGLVEVIPSVRTHPDVIATVEDLVTSSLGKRVIRAPDRAGFIVNALLIPYLLSSIRLLEGGHASADAIDAGMELGCAHPMGPLRLADFIGLDTVQFIAETLYEEYKDPAFAAPPLLRRMVDAGMLGRKSSEGFYSYA